MQWTDCRAQEVFCWPSTHLTALLCAGAAGSSPCASGFGKKSRWMCSSFSAGQLDEHVTDSEGVWIKVIFSDEGELESAKSLEFWLKS